MNIELLPLNCYHLALILDFNQELRNIFSYYQYAQMSSYQLIMAFLPMLLSGNEKFASKTNLIPQPL